MGMKITFNTNSFTVDLGGLSADRKKVVVYQQIEKKL
jgi:hypothetical protein